MKLANTTSTSLLAMQPGGNIRPGQGNQSVFFRCNESFCLGYSVYYNGSWIILILFTLD